MDLGFKGKTVIVTGGVSNIGRAITLAFSAEGANVVIADRDDKTAEKVLGLTAKNTGRTIFVKTDITDYKQVDAMVGRALDEFKAVDVLVNNVGWTNPKLFVESSPEEWNQMIAINYLGAVNCMHACIPHMIERSKGAVVSISSDAARMGEFRESIYGGAKAAIIATTKSIAREVGKYGVRLNVICPGATEPGSADEIGEYSMFQTIVPFSQRPPEVVKKMLNNYPLRRLGKPHDIACSVLFLASDVMAANITGQTLGVDGGYSMV